MVLVTRCPYARWGASYILDAHVDWVAIAGRSELLDVLSDERVNKNLATVFHASPSNIVTRDEGSHDFRILGSTSAIGQILSASSLKLFDLLYSITVGRTIRTRTIRVAAAARDAHGIAGKGADAWVGFIGREVWLLGVGGCKDAIGCVLGSSQPKWRIL